MQQYGLEKTYESVTVISGYEYVRYVEANVTNRQMASTLEVNNGIIIVVGFSQQ